MLEWIKKYQPTLALIGAVIAILGVSLGYRQFSTAREAAKANAYLTMRDRFYHAWNALPKKSDDLEITRDDPNWDLFKQYWYVSFDEWYVTQKIGAFDDLWSGYYESAYIRATDKRSMRTSLCLMRDREFHDGIGREFVRAIELIYSQHHNGQSLCT